MNLTLTIIHVVISLVLVVVVLMQHGKQQGLSGAIDRRCGNVLRKE